MAQVQAPSPTAGVKRASGRTTRAAQPALKKVKASETPVPSSPSAPSPAVESSAPSSGRLRLPTKVSDYRPLPTLPTPQSLGLPASTHQSIAASGVLQASLDRSRLRWVCHGIFERYWVKPETGKNARPPPPNNPGAKSMKSRGACRIRMEPHILECEVYVEDKPKPAVQKVHPQVQYGYGGYGPQYRPGVVQQGAAGGQQRPPPPGPHQTPVRNSPAPLPPSRTQQNTLAQQPEKKPGPDPVISMLATRASSDLELKALMKEVATGAATPEQLRVFQGHIDELTKIINEKKKREEEAAAAAEAKKAQEQQHQSIQREGAAESKPYQPSQPGTPYQPQQHQSWPPPPMSVSQPPPPPPPASAPAVILQFTTPGATEDRFLFPRHTIVESLSPQHLLCSTLVTRKGIAAADSSTLDPATEYFQPITFMVEVAYGRESLLELVRKHVKPADEVRKHMEDVMARCTRAPEVFLAIRLPVKGTEGAETEEERAEEEGKGQEELRKRVGSGYGSNVKYVKKPGPKKGEGGRPVGVKNGEGGGRKAAAAAAAAANTSSVSASTAGAAGDASVDADAQSPAVEKKTEGDGKDGERIPPQMDGTADEKQDGDDHGTTGAEGDAGRPKRTVRKSVRISEG